MTLGQRLYELRKAKNLSQEQVADILGVTRQTVSKWETDQSTPDFDKILPLCQLFDISTDELISGKGSDNIYSDNTYYEPDTENEADEKEYLEKYNKYKVRFAVLTAVAVCLYILSVVPFFIFEKSGLMLSAFFIIIAVATMLIVFGAMSKPKMINKPKTVTKEDKLMKQISSIMSGIVLVIYLLISFLTHAWHITWILWVVYGIACEILKLIFTLKGVEINDEEE